jgi:hypothetical protein
MQFKLLVSLLLASVAVGAPIQQERGLGDLGLGQLSGLTDSLGELGSTITGSGNKGTCSTSSTTRANILQVTEMATEIRLLRQMGLAMVRAVATQPRESSTEAFAGNLPC